MGREGNTLSTTQRDLYDSPPQAKSSPKNNPVTASEPHVGIIGQITPKELRRKLGEIELYNGFANRYLWPLTRRIKSLPAPQDYSLKVAEHARLWRAAILRGHNIEAVTWGDDAGEQWELSVYEQLRNGERPGLPPREGLAQEVCARSHVAVMRIALIFAVLDGSHVIKVDHLNAALAIWDYCERCANYLFSDVAGSQIENVIADALQKRKRMSRDELRGLFGRHISSAALQSALDELESLGKIRMIKEPTPGRSAEIWEWIDE